MRGTTIFACVAALGAAGLLAWGCGGTSNVNGFNTPDGSTGGASSGGASGSGGFGSSGGASGGGSGGVFGDAGPAPMEAAANCTNLQCQVHQCPGGKSTTISGKITDPAGHNPLYNVVAYVPNSKGGALDPIPLGIGPQSCNCDLFSGEPIADALTAPDGTFTIQNAPDGTNIPLVVQIGKWRKEITIPSVSQCTDNKIGNVALPKNAADGKYASIPNIAVSTGGADTLECLLARVGVDQTEFSGDPNTGSAHVHVFQGAGGSAAAGSPSSPASLWDSTNDLDRYDIVLLSCEGTPTTGADATSSQNLAAYVDKGGRVFSEHYHYQFFADGNSGSVWPSFTNTANWFNVANGAPNDAYPGDIGTIIQTTLLQNGKPFPEGQALLKWLGNVGALTNNELMITGGNGRYNAIVTGSNLATSWAQTDPSVSPASTQYMSWDMPFNPPLNDAGVPQYCGRVVYSDMHVSGSSNDPPPGTYTVPSGCAMGTLAPDEDAIEFILFDLSSCIVPVGTTPQPPPPDGGPIFQ